MITLDPRIIEQIAESQGLSDSPEDFLILLEEMLTSGEYEPHEVREFILDVTVKVEVRVNTTTTIRIVK
jgi:hypothetical protein